MSMRPDSIRNVSWAVVRDGAEKRHVYRREVDLHLKDGRIVEITTAGRESVLLVPIQAVVVRTPEELVPVAKRGAKRKGAKADSANFSPGPV